MKFVRKKSVKINAASYEYFLHRDSLTAFYDKAYACKKYSMLKNDSSYKAVMVRLTGCDMLPMYEFCEYIKDAAVILGNICTEEISRIEYGDFLIFTREADMLKERLRFFLGQFAECGQNYVVTAENLDKNEDFDLFFRRAKRHAAAYEISNMTSIAQKL